MHQRDREALIARYHEQYAQLLLHLLRQKDRTQDGTDYYDKARAATRKLYSRRGMWLSNGEAHEKIENACLALTHVLMEHARWNALYPREIFEMLLPLIEKDADN